MIKTSQHVVMNADKKWTVKRTGTTRASRVFDTKTEAIGYACSVATKQKIDVYVHRKDGMVEKKISATILNDIEEKKKRAKKPVPKEATHNPVTVKGK